jgi:P27 family predicted phage terminase small subunit
MGKRGPKPKARAKADPTKSIPRAPKGLDVEARKHWNKVADLVNGSGLASPADEVAMGFYIATWSRWRKAEAELAKEVSPVPGAESGGEVITAINKYRQLNPWYIVASGCLKELKGYLSEFGLTPKARSKLALPEAEEIDSKWDEFED